MKAYNEILAVEVADILAGNSDVNIGNQQEVVEYLTKKVKDEGWLVGAEQVEQNYNLIVTFSLYQHKGEL